MFAGLIADQLPLRGLWRTGGRRIHSHSAAALLLIVGHSPSRPVRMVDTDYLHLPLNPPAFEADCQLGKR
jgi:hypothetical protein